MDPRTRSSYTAFVNRSFRDVADRDYLAARVLYRLNLGSQFLWSAHQAVEKYLKAILLYNDVSTKRLGHDLWKAYQKLYQIRDIPFGFPADVEEFIKYLDWQGNNRYFEKPAFTTGNELLMLDRTVWHIRRYCFWMHGYTTPGPDGKRLYMFPEYIEAIKDFPVGQASKYRMFLGYLERVLDEKSLGHREYLVWKNFYYGSYKKRSIRNFKAHSWSANPAHYLEPGLFEVLRRRVKFSRDVEDLFSRGSKE